MATMSARRKLMIASWRAPQEGNIYGKLTVDATQALAYVDWLRRKTGEKVTVTHLVGRAVGAALVAAPSLNGVIRFGNFVAHPNIAISYLVALDDGKDLAKAKVVDVDKKGVAEIAAELRGLSEKLRTGKDENFEKSKGPLQLLPTWLIAPLVRFTGWITSVLGIAVPALGLESYPFGAAIITNVGVFGLDEGWAPPTPWAHVPVYVLMGAVRDTAVVVDGAVVSRAQLTLCATIDHRYIDGAQGGKLAKVVRSILENPWQLEGMEGPPAEA